MVSAMAAIRIEQPQIIEAALALLDAEGLERLNMRALAERLGVYASALYWHIHNKEQLMSLMAGSFYARAFAATPRRAGWRDWLLGFGNALRTALMAHRDSARLCAIARPTADAKAGADRLAAPLIAAGLTRRTALAYQAAVISLTLGLSIYEQSRAMHDHLAAMIDFDDSFRLGLESMVRGFPSQTRR
jgi:TetR/AcrR family tetracycline transcriptional repressor